MSGVGGGGWWWRCGAMTSTSFGPAFLRSLRPPPSPRCRAAWSTSRCAMLRADSAWLLFQIGGLSSIWTSGLRDRAPRVRGLHRHQARADRGRQRAALFARPHPGSRLRLIPSYPTVPTVTAGQVKHTRTTLVSICLALNRRQPQNNRDPPVLFHYRQNRRASLSGSLPGI